jgi:hypothetical protein
MFGSMLWSGTAYAADSDTERARGLFDEAGDLERQGQWGAAQDRLRAALRLRETPQLHYALGWALENDDKLLEAKAEYEIVTKLGHDKSGAQEATQLAAARLVDFEKKVPVIRVRLSGNTKALARVFVDGRELRHDDDIAAAGVNPGSHVVRVERGAGRTMETVVYVGRGAERVLDAGDTDAVAEYDIARDRHVHVPAPAPVRVRLNAPPHPPPAPDTGPGAMPWLVLAGGVAVASGGAVLLVTADAFDSGASGPESARATAGFVMAGVGLIGATVGAVLLLRDGRHAEKRIARAPGAVFSF